MSKITSYNINGFQNNFNDLEIMINQQETDIFCLQETHIPKNAIPKFKNFNILSKNTETTSTQGVAILISNNVVFKEINIVSQILAVAARISTKTEYSICSIYIHPQQKISKAMLEGLIRQIPPPLILLGDFNAHHNKWNATGKTNDKGKELDDFLTDNDIILLNDQTPTYLHPGTGTLSTLDLALCSPNLVMECELNILPPLQSDHFPLRLSLGSTSPTINPKIFLFNKADWKAYALYIESGINLNTINLNSIKSLTDTIKAAMIKFIPQISPKKKLVPWFDKNVREAFKTKNRTLNQFRKSPSPALRKELNKQNNYLKLLIRRKKKESWQEFTSNININTTPKEMWGKIKAISGKNHKRNNTAHIPHHDSPLEPLANYFKSKFSNSNKPKLKTANSNLSPSENISTPITNFEFEKALSSAKGTSPGFDGINYICIKNLSPDTKKYLIKLYNLILSSNTFPLEWKHAIIVPILKPDKPSNQVNSYRPISLLNCLSKILEKIIVQRIKYFLLKHNLLNKHVFSFKNNTNTTDLLMKLEDYVARGLDGRRHSDCISLDLESAFDKLWPEVVTHHMTTLGFDNKITEFIKNFLTERTFQVKNNHQLSSPHTMECGIPQGSPLSPLLFQIVINSIFQNVEDSEKVIMLIYADDITIIARSGKSRGSKPLRKSLDKISKWCQETGLTFNPNKSCHVHFCRFKNCKHIKYKLSNQQIPESEEVKVLGLYFDKKLSWTKQIQNLNIKNQKILNIVKVLSHQTWGANRENLLKITSSMMYGLLDYGSQVYGNASESRLRSLDPIYHSAVRAAIGAFKTSPIASILAEANLTSLKDRRKLARLKSVAKIYSTPTHPLFKNNPTNASSRPCCFKNKIANDTPNPTSLPHCLPLNMAHTPPWFDATTFIDDNLKYRIGPTSSSLEAQQYYLEAINKYPNHTKIFTDGSKNSNSTAYGVYIPEYNLENSYKLHNANSIFSAEAAAICKAMSIVRAHDSEKKCVIVTDSLSVLQAVGNAQHNNAYIQIIRKEILKDERKGTSFLWVPSHRGLAGNDKADELAQEGHSNIDLDHNLITKEDFIRLGKALHLEERIKLWKTQQKNLANFKPNLEYAKQPKDMTRRESVIITRLRIGHTDLTHGHLLDKQRDSPRCKFCNDELTIDHIISCDCYGNLASLINLRNTNESYLDYANNNFNLVFKFLKDLNIYDKI